MTSFVLCEYDTPEVAERMSIIAEAVMNERVSDDISVSVVIEKKWKFHVKVDSSKESL